MIALTAAALFTPTERIADAMLLIEDGTIAEVTSRGSRTLPNHVRVVDLGDDILAPGLIDIHIHGGGGRDGMEATPRALSWAMRGEACTRQKVFSSQMLRCSIVCGRRPADTLRL